ncbi:reverse transcriptase domain-containing protein [Cyanobacterium aponinum]|uniref:reverse transcriptase domain-containing protein n=1 Tax=Cyanobacterium aponinum TaxID=379064 RepID=UPI000C12A7AE|nr:reverse transcriptase domain-containing protein [Cyanobacterium aponinum]PHV64062.1 RNA-dependent DNA polymerase [Cyanobacterium aponinum IPPAS B-1201]
MVHQKDSENWEDINWKYHQKVVFRLQKRIFKAVREGDIAKTHRLQRLLFNSYSARMIAIRQVTQLNQGRKTAGIDGKKALRTEERLKLEKHLKRHSRNWNHEGLKEIPIPKKDGTKRILKVPTIADRAWQCLVKLVLDPAHEATFHERSYGFRIGRSAHDAHKVIFLNLNKARKGWTKRILELDIEKCFDRISHDSILEKLISPEYLKRGIRKCLKAGVNPEFPQQGTPQGGVVSPLLANIALNGIERIGEFKDTDRKIRSKCVRYADDMIFFLKPEDNEVEILEKIEEFLKERGMNISQKKTRVTATTDGFNFLGWKFYIQKNGKFKSEPSEENFKNFQKKAKEIINCSNYGAEIKAMKLAPIIRGWRNYHKYTSMKGSRFGLWGLNERTRKVFIKQKSIDKHKAVKLVTSAFPYVNQKENGFNNVKGNKSPYDGDMTYWSKRSSNLYDGATERAMKKQNHKCGYCGLNFYNDEKVELHHKDCNHENWKVKNLLAVHSSCHHYIHMSKNRKDTRSSEAG